MPTQTERTESTRRALLAAGRELFAQRGYAAVGVGEIAERANVTTGAIYHQFDSKAGLFRAIYVELVANTNERIAQARLKNATPSLITDCELYLDACADPAFFRLTADAPAVIGWDQIIHDTSSLIAASLTAAQDEGEIPADLPTAPLARMLAAALKEAGVMIATAKDPAQARADAGASAQRLLAGLRTTK